MRRIYWQHSRNEARNPSKANWEAPCFNLKHKPEVQLHAFGRLTALHAFGRCSWCCLYTRSIQKHPDQSKLKFPDVLDHNGIFFSFIFFWHSYHFAQSLLLMAAMMDLASIHRVLVSDQTLQHSPNRAVKSDMVLKFKVPPTTLSSSRMHPIWFKAITSSSLARE